MDLRDYVAAIHAIPGIGWQTIKRLDDSGDWQRVMRAGIQELRAMQVSEAKARAIAALRPSDIQRMKRQYQQEKIEFVTYWDEHYPRLLKETNWAPWVLYYMGNWSLVHQPGISIVGTRVPTAYGRRVTELFAESLSVYGFCIVSGLARGIDSIAHQAALRIGNGTIAVLGTPLDVIYPPENRKLYQAIAEQGLIISEYPLGTGLTQGMFPLRNRIIAGLSLGTIVIEGKTTSGALITADRSLEASREVFAIPGPITSPKSHGPLHRIREGGAKMVLHPEDVIQEFQHRHDIMQQLGLTPKFNHQAEDSSVDQSGKISNPTSLSAAQILNKDEQFVLDLIGGEPILFDHLLTKSKFSFGHLHSILLSLTMKKQIVQIPGSMYIRTN